MARGNIITREELRANNRYVAPALALVQAMRDGYMEHAWHGCDRRAPRMQSLKPRRGSHEEAHCTLWNASGGPTSNNWDRRQCPLVAHTAALQCLNGSSIAFVGDSQMRDLAYATAHFLCSGSIRRADVTPAGNANQYSTHFRRAEPFGVASFPSNFGDAYGSEAGDAWTTDWHVDYYHMLVPNWPTLCEIANGEGPREYAYVFVSTGLHDFCVYPGEALASYIGRHVAPLVKVSNTTVWLPMNRECVAKLHPSVDLRQAAYANDCNARAFEYLAHHEGRYLNIDAIFRQHEVCDVSADGLHMKLASESVRSQAIISQICA